MGGEFGDGRGCMAEETGACKGLMMLADATEKVNIEVSRIWTIIIPSQLDQSK